jgi:hypothetical protein
LHPTTCPPTTLTLTTYRISCANQIVHNSRASADVFNGKVDFRKLFPKHPHLRCSHTVQFRTNRGADMGRGSVDLCTVLANAALAASVLAPTRFWAVLSLVAAPFNWVFTLTAWATPLRSALHWAL